jgi:hypothetical protein
MSDQRFESFMSKIEDELSKVNATIPELDYDELLEVINLPVNYKDLSKD